MDLKGLAPLALVVALGCDAVPPSEPGQLTRAERPLSLSTPLELDPTPRLGATLGGQMIQNDGQNFIVAWLAQRGVLPNVYTTRVSPSGVVLDPFGVRVARCLRRAGGSLTFTVGGGQQLVAWGESYNGGSIIEGALGEPGKPPSSPRLDILPSQPTVSMVAGWDGTGFSLSMPRGQNPSVIFVRVLSDGGTTAPTQLRASYPYGVNVLGLGTSNGLVGVASYENTNMGYYADFLTLVDPATGSVVGTTDLGQSTAIRYVVTGDARGFVVAHTTQGQSHTIIQRVSPAGVLVNDAGTDVTPSTPAIAYSVDSLPNGNLLFGVSGSVGAGYAPGVLEVSEDAGTFAPVSTFLSLDGGGAGGTVDCIGATCLLGYGSSNPALKLAAVIYSPDAGDGAPFPLDSSLRAQWNPKAAFASDRYLSVWEEPAERGTEYYGRLLDECGGALSPPFQIAAPSGYGVNQTHGTYALTALGDRFLLVYPRSFPLMLSARFIERDAGVGPELDLPVGTQLNNLSDFAAQTDGTNALIAWTSLKNGSYSINGALIAADGTLLTPGYVISGAGNWFGPMVDLSLGEQGYQVLWTDFSNGFNNGRLRTVSLFPDGGVASPTLTFPASLTQDDSQALPLLGFDGVHHYAAWLDSALPSPAVRLAQFDEDGGIWGDGGEVLGTPGAASIPSAISCGDGRCFVLHSELSAGAYRLRGLELSSDGGRQSLGSSLESQPDDEFVPAVAFGDGGALLTWTRYQPAPFGSMRAAARLIEGACAAPFDAGVDGGASDAGDGGTATDGGALLPLHATVGCGCGATPTGAMILLWFIAAQLGARRRRRDV